MSDPRAEIPFLKAVRTLASLLIPLAGMGLMTMAQTLESSGGAVVHRPVNAFDRQEFGSLPQAAVLMGGNASADGQRLASRFAAAHADGRTNFAAGTKLVVLSTGPLLDGPDQIAVHPMLRHGNQLDLEIAHTQVRLQDAPMLRNVTWRPIVEVALPELPAGRYQLLVRWQPLASLPDGTPLSSTGTIQALSFELHQAAKP